MMYYFQNFKKLYKKQFDFPVVSVLRLQGTISSTRGKNILNLEGTLKKIEDAFKPERLARVLVSVNSPGGSPVQSDLITSYLKLQARKTKVPVTVFVEDIAASGGYWLACAGDDIFASKSSVLGSLGVIYSGLGLTELIKKVGVERRLVTSGKSKALMDPLSPTKEEDVAIIKNMCVDIHKVFIEHVKTSRGSRLTGTDEELFNGSIWTAESALRLGLIDGIDQAETFIHRNYGDEVKVNRVKGKYEELFDMFGSRSLSPHHSISEMVESDSNRIKI